MKARAALFSLLCLMGASGAMAATKRPVPSPAVQSVPPQAGEGTSGQEWSDVTEVVVRAKVSGPAMWKLKRGDATVWVMGVPVETPQDLQWDQTRLKRILKGVNFVIVPGFSRGSSQADKRWLAGSELPYGTHLEDVVAPKTYARFKAAVAQEPGLRAADYILDRPMRAGMELFEDVLKARGIRRYDMTRQVMALADAAGARTKIAYTVNADLLSDQWLLLDAKGNEACLTIFLDGIDNLKSLPGMTRAWSEGDVKTALASYRDSAMLTCNLTTPGWREQYDALFIGGMVSSIGEALAKPGKSLAVVPFSDLLRKDGVLDRLRAQGVEVSSPVE